MTCGSCSFSHRWLHEAGDGVSFVLERFRGDAIFVRLLAGEHRGVGGRLAGHGGVVA